MQKAGDAMRAGVAGFVLVRCDIGARYYAEFNDLWEAWIRAAPEPWMWDDGRKPQFAKALTGIVPSIVKGRVGPIGAQANVYYGIGLKPQ